MNFKKELFIIAIILSVFIAKSQNENLVYIKDGEFIEDCNVWQPKVLNYLITINEIQSPALTFISPNINAFNTLESQNTYCNTAADGISRIRADFQMMKQKTLLVDLRN